MKKIFFLLFSPVLFCCFSFAQTMQPCFTDEMYQRNLQQHPEIAKFQLEMERQISENLKKVRLGNLAKTTQADTAWYDVPIVIHVIHDYDKTPGDNTQGLPAGAEFLTDSAIFSAVAGWNIVYALQNGDTSTVIQPFKKYIGNPRIRLHLATKDPYGNPTHGITRRRSYLTYFGDDQAKFDEWPPASYVNIWFIYRMSQTINWAAAYAYWPSEAAAIPYYDGVISRADYMANFPENGNVVGKTINHEIGHVFNLYHPWGSTNSPGVACGDDDVDDTPPTKGHGAINQGCNDANLYDSVCAQGYVKVYSSSVPGIDSLVDYPDTTNAQNIMDYTYCARMFTIGQVERMHAALQSTIAGRSNLWDTLNLVLTGALAPWPDLPPVPEFSVDNSFVCIGTPVNFTNFSWNDTVTNVNWSFSNGGATINKTPFYPDEYFINPTLAKGQAIFSSPGWVTVTQKVTGNGSGSATLVDNTRLFVADTVPVNGNGYCQEFNPGSGMSNWPMFNYYNNEFKWQLANVGYYDNTSIEYTGFDSRIGQFSNPETGLPRGDYDDFYTPYFNLSELTGAANPVTLNFMYSGAARAGDAADINDTLIIFYSQACNTHWDTLITMQQASLDNKGSLSIAYAPEWQGDWALKSIPLTSAMTSGNIAFRFRYRPGVNGFGYQYPPTGNVGYSTGNNFYMDRLNFSNFPAGVNTVLPPGDHEIVIAPNPTNGDAYVVVKDMDGSIAKMVVTDIAGRLVYTARQQVSASTTIITIPRSVIPVSGIYLVNVSTPYQVHTGKLVVY